MWFWEVIYKDENGNEFAIRSSQGFRGCGEAFLAYQSVSHRIGKTVKDVGGIVIIKEHIIYIPGFPRAVRDTPL